MSNRETDRISRKPLPSLEFLRECLEYRDGCLYWVRRPLAHFASDRAGAQWNGRQPGKLAGNLDPQGYLRTRISGVVYSNHRLTYYLHTGEQPDYLDHVNGERDDNRIENLRPCTNAQNQWNRIVVDKGIYRAAGKWQVSISANGRLHYQGVFEDIAEARACAAKAIKELHGEFARI
jgi:hypothetical protein